MRFPPAFFVLCLVALVSSRPPQEQAGLSPYEIDDVLPGKLCPRPFNGTWLCGTTFAFKNENGDLKTFDVKERKFDTLVTAEEVKRSLRKWKSSMGADCHSSKIDDLKTKNCHCKCKRHGKDFNITGFQLSPNQKYVLFHKDNVQAFRHSSVFRCFIYDLDTKEITSVAGDRHVQLACWVPHSSSLIFVRENNVYFRKTPADREIALTLDGEPGLKYNGVTDWVYEEEMMGTASALWASPDGLWIAIATFDDSNVEESLYFCYGESGTIESQNPELIDLRYPKPGRANPVARVKIIRLADVRGRNCTWTELPVPEDVVSADNLLADVTWASNTELAVTWMNRRQNCSVMVICQMDGRCKTELITVEPRGWLNVQTPWFYSEGTRYLTVHSAKQADGTTWPHLFGADIGSPPKPITSGYRTVITIIGLDSVRNHIFYMSTTPESAAHCEVHVAGSKCFSLTKRLYKDDGTRCSFGMAKFSKDYSYAALSCAGPDPPHVVLFDVVNEEIVTVWEDNRKFREDISKFSRHTIKDMMIDVPNGFQAQVRLRLPPGFNEANTAKKYPMIVSVYGGPASKKVLDRFTIRFQDFLITNKQFIYCEIDGRGSAFRSDELMFQLNNVLGTIEIDDQISVTRKLTKMFGFIDSERIGIWGWSYGGYASAMALVRDKENIFKCGISVAPVTSWLYYDTIYTERYMGTPAENPQGYNDSDITLHAEGFRGKGFLLIHGNADDNVHYQQSMQLVRRLELLNIPFEFQSYPNEAHGLSRCIPHVFSSIDRFWTKCLCDNTPKYGRRSNNLSC